MPCASHGHGPKGRPGTTCVQGEARRNGRELHNQGPWRATGSPSVEYRRPLRAHLVINKAESRTETEKSTHMRGLKGEGRFTYPHAVSAGLRHGRRRGRASDTSTAWELPAGSYNGVVDCLGIVNGTNHIRSLTVVSGIRHIKRIPGLSAGPDIPGA